MITYQDIIDELFAERKIYDYTEEYKKKFIQDVKKTFIKKCKADTTLSKEYKEYISHLENVDVRINYGWRFNLTYYRITVKYDYAYRDTYKSGEHITGTAQINSSGEVSVSGMQVHSDYTTSDFYSQSTASFSSTARKQYATSFGSAEKYSNRLYVEITKKENASAELCSIFDSKPTVTQFDEYIQKNPPTNIVQDAIEYETKLTRVQLKNFRLLEIEDVGVDRGEMIVLPSSFDVIVKYKNKLYEQKGLYTFEDIRSIGENNPEYLQFKARRSELEKTKRASFAIIPRVISYIGIISLLIALMRFAIFSLEGLFPQLVFFIDWIAGYFLIRFINNSFIPFFTWTGGKDDRISNFQKETERMETRYKKQKRQNYWKAFGVLFVCILLAGLIPTNF